MKINEANFNEPIAIIGMNCQFPGVHADIEDVDAFYELLINKQTSIKDVPSNRWDIDHYYDADREKEGKIISRKGGFLINPQLFDAGFFKISATEAQQIDPQQRLFLEVSIRALNHANIRLDSLDNSNTGVYCGISTHDYNQLNYKDKIQFNTYTNQGSTSSAAAGRLSYFLNLKGPSLTVDTACSSSLSALYLAVSALRNQFCELAIVGGVHFSLCPEPFISVSKANMLSAQGQCRSFDANADGYVRSEGCGVIVVKRLSDAVKDKNTILAVINGIVMNQNGVGRSLAAPNKEAQIALHQAALNQASLEAKNIDYIEAHGSGTVAGDAVEFNALQAIHEGQHLSEKPLIISTLKSNIGHTISSSGIASLIKAVMALNKETIPANLYYSSPNHKIDPKSIPAILPVETMDFAKTKDKKRIVQVFNFGFTGTNVTAIIEEAPEITPTEVVDEQAENFCFVASAESEYSLQKMMAAYLKYLHQPAINLQQVCNTLINCRDHYKFRCAVICKDKEELIKKIESGDYEIKKLVIEKNIQLIANDAEKIYQGYLSGKNIRLANKQNSFDYLDLPLYVFDRKEYWHETEFFEEDKTPKNWCFKFDWQPQAINNVENSIKGQRWLFIGDQRFALGFKKQGIEIVGESEELSFSSLDRVIFAPSLSENYSDDVEANLLWQKNTLKKLLGLIKELVHKKIQLPLVVLTSNAIAEFTDAKLNLGSSALVGFCKTLVLELPQFHTMLIDVDNIESDDYSSLIITEITTNNLQSYEHIIAYRQNQRYVPRLRKTELPEENPNINEKGRFLITGGCGALGLVTAETLLAIGARELMLVSRTVDTPSILTAIKKLQDAYPDCLIRTESLDITNKNSLRCFLQNNNKDGLLKGIIHAAGVSFDAPLLEHKDEDIDFSFAAKVQGGWYLHELTQTLNLDFFIVYSSISSVFGSNRKAAYSASNSFLDALIAERRRLGLVGTSIQWGPWAEAGMAKWRARDKNLKKALIHNHQASDFIRRLIRSQSNQITVISPDYLKFMLEFVPKPFPAFYSTLATELNDNNQSNHPTSSSWLTTYSKIKDENKFIACKEMLSELCREILQLPATEELEEDEGFFELGFDSLIITSLLTKLKEKLDSSIAISATTGFDYPSINKLAKYIETELDLYLTKNAEPHVFPNSTEESIAIIGMSCDLPNASDLAAYEVLLEQGLSGIKDIPLDRWNNKKYYDPDPNTPLKSYVKKLGLMDNIKCFDANFFGISPSEAAFIDPQQRIFLENCYRAMEHANYPSQSLRGSLTGVFAGAGSTHEYFIQLEKAGVFESHHGMFFITGRALNIISGRVTYVFDFKGPAITIDTACSSSLVAIHYACQSLKKHEIDYALAGGVNVLLRPEGIVNLCRTKTLALDSQCKTFDKAADGYVRSEGCGVLLLKRLSDALRDKDTILAVIKASAINNDGKSAGLTVPNGKSQEEVMRQALKQTNLSTSDISYIETHGTGTAIGDPIEVNAINKIYGASRSPANPLFLGAVKTNIGHLESASGAASVIKTVLSLQKRKIFKNLNFSELNPNINLGNTQLALNNMDWNTMDKLNSAGVSAFGFSGTNAHLILQEHPQNSLPNNNSPANVNVLILSAKTETALENLKKSYETFLETTADNFSDICYTAATGRDHFKYRLAVIAKSNDEAKQQLEKEEYLVSSNYEQGFDNQHSEIQLLVRDYLAGKKVDWLSFYQKQSKDFIKVSLPHYVFDRSKLWLLKEDQEEIISHDAMLEHLYTIQWQALDLPTLSENSPELTVFAKDRSRAKQFLGGIKYHFVDDLRLLDDLSDKHIVYFFEQGQFLDLFDCCQLLFKSLPASFLLITQNAYTIDSKEQDKINPFHTMASAFWKSFRNELAFSKNYTIDIDSSSKLESCLNFLFNSSTEETQFLIRNTLYVPRLKKKTLAFYLRDQQPNFDSNASYLITGGTGGLANLLIDYLIRNQAKHIILTSRSECPVEIKKRIEKAKEQQVVISHYQIDASNFEQMEGLFKNIKLNQNLLKGVFHLAGIIQDNLLVNITKEQLQNVLSAKMESAQILHQLTSTMELDYFVLFSSAASVLGSKGQANYVAANGFLDGLAHLRQQQNLPAVAINWGAFDSAGMAAKRMAALQRQGFIALEKESFNVMDALLLSQLPQVILLPLNWDNYFNNLPIPKEFSELVDKNFSTVEFLPFLQKLSKKDRISILGQELCKITAKVLKLDRIEQIGIKNDLFSMGMDSLTSLELRNQIYDKLQCPTLTLPIEYFITEPRIDKIAKRIAKELDLYFDSSYGLPLAESPTEEAVAVCDAQWIFWMTDRVGGNFNCGMQLQLHGSLNKEYLAQAFDFTIQQNSVFWTTFSKQAPIQTHNREGTFTLIDEDISHYFNRDILNEVFYDNVMGKFSLSKPPLIKIYLFKLSDNLHEVHIIIPHIILDDSSYRILYQQFQHNYKTLMSGNKLESIEEPYDYFDYVRRNNLHYQKNLNEKIDFWRIYNKGFQKLFFGRNNHLPDASNQGQNLFHYSMDSDLIERFRDWHHKKNINVSTGLIAACQIVFYKLSQQNKIPIMILHSGREGSRYKSVIGLFMEYKRINTTLNEDYQFIEFVKAIENQLLITAPYQKCMSDIKNRGLKNSRLKFLEYLFYLYTKLAFKKDFKKTKLNSIILDYQLMNLSQFFLRRFTIKTKYFLNRFLKLKLALRPPASLRVVINITSGFFIKGRRYENFADLEASIPCHYGSINKPVGNQTLWVYFSKDQHGEYRISINGPLTLQCKDQIAEEFKQLLTTVLENDDFRIADLI